MTTRDRHAWLAAYLATTVDLAHVMNINEPMDEFQMSLDQLQAMSLHRKIKAL